MRAHEDTDFEFQAAGRGACVDKVISRINSL